MKFMRYYGWLIPVVVFGAIAIVTPVSPWLLGLAALVVIMLGWAVGWVIARTRESRAH